MMRVWWRKTFAHRKPRLPLAMPIHVRRAINRCFSVKVRTLQGSIVKKYRDSRVRFAWMEFHAFAIKTVRIVVGGSGEDND